MLQKKRMILIDYFQFSVRPPASHEERCPEQRVADDGHAPQVHGLVPVRPPVPHQGGRGTQV